MYSITKYVGFDVSKEKIAVSVADFGIAPARFFGLIENSPEKIRKILKRLGKPEELYVCYEAGDPDIFDLEGRSSCRSVG
jgi:transposase